MKKKSIDKELLQEISHFEDFLSKIGFKRIEGAIYGLLVLSKDPLSSDEIEDILKLSQSAVSQALKVLSLYGAIETLSASGDKRVKLHSAKEDSLSIVSSVFRKREQETIEEFRAMAQRLVKKLNDDDRIRSKRLNSIITTCEIAESVMNFIIKLAQKGVHLESPQIVKRIPRALDLVLTASETFSPLANGLKNTFTHKIKNSGRWPFGEMHE